MPLKQAVDQSRSFAFGEYLTALTKGKQATDAERTAMAQKLARFTGLSADHLERANLRITPEPVPQGTPPRQAARRRPPRQPLHIDRPRRGRANSDEFDLSNSALQGPYTAMFQDYLKNELKWETDLHYPSSGNVRPWD